MCAQHAHARKTRIPINGMVSLSARHCAMMDTPLWQTTGDRLQLQVSYLVYRGATHTRAEHMIGVCDWIGRVARLLLRKQPELATQLCTFAASTEEAIEVMQAAGLWHDQGQIVASHFFDRRIMPELIRVSKGGLNADGGSSSSNSSNSSAAEMLELHEQRSVWNLHLGNHLYGWNFTPHQLRVMGDMIQGSLRPEQQLHPQLPNADDAAAFSNFRTPPFCIQLLSNHVFGLDMDRVDYIHRDPYHAALGSSDHLQIDRLIDGLAVLDGKLALHRRVAPLLLGLLSKRRDLFLQVYTHEFHARSEPLLRDLCLAIAQVDDWAGAFRHDPNPYRNTTIPRWCFWTDAVYKGAMARPDIYTGRLDTVRKLAMMWLSRKVYRIADSHCEYLECETSDRGRQPENPCLITATVNLAELGRPDMVPLWEESSDKDPTPHLIPREERSQAFPFFPRHVAETRTYHIEQAISGSGSGSGGGDGGGSGSSRSHVTK